jgi:hypothetical protein
MEIFSGPVTLAVEKDVKYPGLNGNCLMVKVKISPLQALEVLRVVRG